MGIETIGFAGFGSMGQALCKGLLLSGALDGSRLAVLSRGAGGRAFARNAGAFLCQSPAALAERADMVILAVKPKDALGLLGELSPALDGKALLSVVAGLDYAAIRAALLPARSRLLITLPNTPVAVGAGVVALTTESDFSAEEKDFTQKLFEKIALVEWISEKQLGALSALSGSAPAYLAIIAEALADGAVAEGLSRAAAGRLAAQTLAGTGRLLLETGLPPAVIKDQVASPGGTTIEGLAVLERAAVRSSLIEAVRAGAAKFARLFPSQ